MVPSSPVYTEWLVEVHNYTIDIIALYGYIATNVYTAGYTK